jgi:hypothetical protein
VLWSVPCIGGEIVGVIYKLLTHHNNAHVHVVAIDAVPW